MTVLSIVCPSKNRPKLLDEIINNFIEHSVADIELIIVDNPSDPLLYLDRDLSKYPNIYYIRPPKYLSMCENWNFGLSYASGKYVSFLMDKSLFLPGSLECISDVLRAEIYDIVSWRFMRVTAANPGIHDFNQKCSIDNDVSRLIDPPEIFDPAEELFRRRQLGSHHGSTDFQLSRGRILTSAFHNSLISRVKLKYGDLFQPMSPDYTSTTLALSIAGKCIDLNIPMITVTKFHGNGHYLLARDISKQDFYKDNFISSNKLPFKNLSLPISNYVAHDVYINEWIIDRSCEYSDLSWRKFIIMCIRELNVIRGNYLKRLYELSYLISRLFYELRLNDIGNGFFKILKMFRRRLIRTFSKINHFDREEIHFYGHAELVNSRVLSVFGLVKFRIPSFVVGISNKENERKLSAKDERLI